MLDFQTRRSDFWNDIKIINNDVRKVYLHRFMLTDLSATLEQIENYTRTQMALMG